jgi:hypothetical protein
LVNSLLDEPRGHSGAFGKRSRALALQAHTASRFMVSRKSLRRYRMPDVQLPNKPHSQPEPAPSRSSILELDALSFLIADLRDVFCFWLVTPNGVIGI